MKDRITTYLPELVALRRDLHRHPELGFEESRTSSIVASHLENCGLRVHRGWAKTGVVGVLTKGSSPDCIALRADMDGLPMQEKANRKHASARDGLMHSCGHDGHVVMLLGAARYLALSGDFDGTVVFIFQPAEEGGGGGRLMVEEGIVDRFGIQAVYGMHNRSGIEAGHFATRPGAIMSATDNFEIRIQGQGTHAALPHTGVDPILAASQLVTALQSVVSKEVKALDSAVISVTQFLSGTTYNIIPDEAVLRGCTRYRSEGIGRILQESMERITAGVCASNRTHYTFNYMPGYPLTINHPAKTEVAVQAAVRTVGEQRVDGATAPLMASEDFSFFLQKVPGCYVFIGNGMRTQNHGSDYDFNDDIIETGVRYWVNLVRLELGKDLESRI